MRLLKIVSSIVVLLVLICVAASICLVYFIDPNKLKPILAEQVLQKTGYKLVIDGPLGWSFYPRLGVKIEHMTLTAPHQTAAFIDLQGVRIATVLSQLLHGNQQLQGEVTIAHVTLMNLQVQDVSADLHWKNNVLTLQPIYATLYDGTLVGVAHGSELAKVPHWDWDVTFNDMQIKPLLQDVSGKAIRLSISGLGSVKLQAATQGNNRDELLNNLNGSGEYTISNGIVEGMDLNYLVQTADALINKQPVTAFTNSNLTLFSRLSGDMVIRSGVATTNNLLLVTPALITHGTGSVGLNSQDVDFHLRIKTQETLKTQWEIPVIVNGSMSHPNVRLDTQEIEAMLAKQELTKLKVKAKDEIKKHIPGKTGEFLQNLLGD